MYLNQTQNAPPKKKTKMHLHPLHLETSGSPNLLACFLTTGGPTEKLSCPQTPPTYTKAVSHSIQELLGETNLNN